MSDYERSEDFRLGEYWLSKRPGSDSWHRTWFDSTDRQTRRVSLRTSDTEQAKQKLTDWFIDQHRPQEAPPSVVTIAEVLAAYWEGHASTLVSADNARISARYWLDFFGVKTIAEIAPPREQRKFHAWLARKGMKNSTISRVISVGRAAINYAWKNGELESAPFIADVKIESQEPLGRPLSLAETVELIDAMKSEHQVRFALLLIATCARPDAVRDLQKSQCDFDHNLIHLNPPGRTQTKKYRPTVKLPEQFRKMLEDSRPGYLVQYAGKPVKEGKVAWRRARRDAGLDEKVNPYSLRHTMARWMRSQGVPAWEVSAQLGHKQPGMSTTEIYAPFDPTYLERAAEAIDAFAYQLRSSSELVDSALSAKLLKGGRNNGGRYWIRTSDPSDVNTVLYQLS